MTEFPSPSQPSSGQAPGKRRFHAALGLTSVSVLVNLGLAALKIAVGVVGHSYALIADGIESSADALTSAIVWVGFRQALRPPDDDHPFGHGKAESLAGLAVALALVAAALLIAVHGVQAVIHPGATPKWYTLAVLAFVIPLKAWMARRVHLEGHKLDSSSLKSDAWHHASDAITSVAAFIGISIAIAGGPKFAAADGCAALVAAVVIAINGFHLIAPAFNEVMDGAPPKDIEQTVRVLSEGVAGVRAIEKCRIRKSGLELYVDIHVVVDGAIPVRDGHEIAHAVKDHLVASDLHIADVDVHIEPDKA